MLPNQNVTNSSHEIIYEMYFPQKLKSVTKERRKITKYNIFKLQALRKSVTIHVTILLINKVLFFKEPFRNQFYQLFCIGKQHTFQATSINE